jgi:hypothetical protein
MRTSERRAVLLGEHDQPSGEIMSPFELTPYKVAVPQSAQHRKQVAGSIDLLA